MCYEENFGRASWWRLGMENGWRSFSEEVAFEPKPKGLEANCWQLCLHGPPRIIWRFLVNLGPVSSGNELTFTLPTYECALLSRPVPTHNYWFVTPAPGILVSSLSEFQVKIKKQPCLFRIKNSTRHCFMHIVWHKSPKTALQWQRPTGNNFF